MEQICYYTLLNTEGVGELGDRYDNVGRPTAFVRKAEEMVRKERDRSLRLDEVLRASLSKIDLATFLSLPVF